MIKYIVLVKLKSDVPPDKVEEVIQELKDLGRTVPEVKSGSVGKAFLSIPGRALDWDLAFVWEFENMEAVQRYGRHPFHGPMDARIRPYFERSTSVKYEFEPGTL